MEIFTLIYVHFVRFAVSLLEYVQEKLNGTKRWKVNRTSHQRIRTNSEKNRKQFARNYMLQLRLQRS